MLGGSTITGDGTGVGDIRIDPLPNNLPTRLPTRVRGALPLYDMNGQPFDVDSLEPGFQRAMASIAINRALEFNRQAKTMEAMRN
jgi:hypothetical protein